MQWFKHYHNASSSLSIQLMMKKLGVSGYGHYFLLLELLCEKFDGQDTVIRLTPDEIKRKLRTTRERVDTVMKCFQDSRLINYRSSGDSLEIVPRSSGDSQRVIGEQSPEYLEIECHILLDLKDKDFARARKVRGLSAVIPRQEKELDKDKELDKEKEKDYIKTKVLISSDHPKSDKSKPKGCIVEFSRYNFLLDFLKTVGHDVQKKWIENYPTEMLDTEFKKMDIWLSSNPNKAPRINKAQFVSRWLSKAYDQHRKTITANSGNVERNSNFYNEFREFNPYGE